MNASKEEREKWPKIKEREMAEFKQTELSKGWVISDEWDGFQPVAKYAKRIDSPPA